jgi:hypothetical protein
VVSEKSIEDARPVTVKVHHNSDYPSALYVPIARPATADEPEAPLACFGSVLSQDVTA